MYQEKYTFWRIEEVCYIKKMISIKTNLNQIYINLNHNSKIILNICLFTAAIVIFYYIYKFSPYKYYSTLQMCCVYKIEKNQTNILKKWLNFLYTHMQLYMMNIIWISENIKLYIYSLLNISNL